MNSHECVWLLVLTALQENCISAPDLQGTAWLHHCCAESDDRAGHSRSPFNLYLHFECQGKYHYIFTINFQHLVGQMFNTNSFGDLLCMKKQPDSQKAVCGRHLQAHTRTAGTEGSLFAT